MFLFFLYLITGSGDMDGLPKVRLTDWLTDWLSVCLSIYLSVCKELHILIVSSSSVLQNSPNNMAGMNNPPGTPRDDGEMAGNFLNPFQSESVSTKGDNIPLKLGTI